MFYLISASPTLTDIVQNMTGPGRPGRDDQASLTAMAAAELGWDYPKLLAEMLSGAVTLRDIRQIKPDVK